MSQVRTNATGDRVTIPVTEETVENYSTWAENYLTKGGTDVWRRVDDDVTTGPRLWKATQLIGNDAFDDNNSGFGAIRDILFDNEKVTAVVLSTYAGYGGGYRAVPYDRYGYRWNPDGSRYSLVYTGDELRRLPVFDYQRMRNRAGEAGE